MSHRTSSVVAVLAVLLLAAPPFCRAAEEPDGKIKVRGEWVNGELDARRPEKADPRDLRGDGVAGHIDESGDGWFRIGPVRVDVGPETEFRDLTAEDLVPGRPVKVRGELSEPRRLEAEKIRPTTIDPGEIQLWGVPRNRVLLEEGGERVVLLGVPVTMPTPEEVRLRTLAVRPEDVRPDERWKVPLFGRPLTIGGELETRTQSRLDYRLDPRREDDDIQLRQRFKVELIYEWSPQISALFKGKVAYDADLYREDNREDIDTSVERDESWVFFSEIFGSDFGVQVGRQDFREKLNWWWDQDVDALRIHYDRRHLHLETAVARNLFGSDSGDSDRDDPATDRALRLLGHARWKWIDDHLVEAFFVYASGDVHEPAPGSIVNESFNTEPEPDLHWLGGRVRGKGEPADGWKLKYHFQAAWVDGEERFSVLDDTDDDQQVVISREKISVSGWGVDGAFGLELSDLPGNPSLTLGGAAGSADEDDELRRSGGFRQTGLQSNRAKIEGVNRLRYYGELYRPNLTNIAVSSAILTADLLEKSSLELAFHTYHQLEKAPFVSDSAISTRPDGTSTDLGFEVDLVLSLREWGSLDFRGVVALFRAGDAYGDFSGQTAELIGLSLDYGF